MLSQNCELEKNNSKGDLDILRSLSLPDENAYYS